MQLNSRPVFAACLAVLTASAHGASLAPRQLIDNTDVVPSTPSLLPGMPAAAPGGAQVDPVANTMAPMQPMTHDVSVATPTISEGTGVSAGAVSPTDQMFMCTRPLAIPAVQAVADVVAFSNSARHCYIKIVPQTSATPSYTVGFGPSGIEQEPHLQAEYTECYPLTGHATPSSIVAAADLAAKSGVWKGSEYSVCGHNCCNFVDAVLQTAGADGVGTYPSRAGKVPNWPCPHNNPFRKGEDTGPINWIYYNQDQWHGDFTMSHEEPHPGVDVDGVELSIISHLPSDKRDVYVTIVGEKQKSNVDDFSWRNCNQAVDVPLSLLTDYRWDPYHDKIHGMSFTGNGQPNMVGYSQNFLCEVSAEGFDPKDLKAIVFNVTLPDNSWFAGAGYHVYTSGQSMFGMTTGFQIFTSYGAVGTYHGDSKIVSNLQSPVMQVGNGYSFQVRANGADSYFSSSYKQLMIEVWGPASVPSLV